MKTVSHHLDLTKFKRFRRFLHNGDVLALHFTKAVDFLPFSVSEPAVEESALVLLVQPGIASVDVLHMDHDCKVPQEHGCPQKMCAECGTTLNHAATDGNNTIEL